MTPSPARTSRCRGICVLGPQRDQDPEARALHGAGLTRANLEEPPVALDAEAPAVRQAGLQHHREPTARHGPDDDAERVVVQVDREVGGHGGAARGALGARARLEALRHRRVAEQRRTGRVARPPDPAGGDDRQRDVAGVPPEGQRRLVVGQEDERVGVGQLGVGHGDRGRERRRGPRDRAGRGRCGGGGEGVQPREGLVGGGAADRELPSGQALGGEPATARTPPVARAKTAISCTPSGSSPTDRGAPGARGTAPSAPTPKRCGGSGLPRAAMTSSCTRAPWRRRTSLVSSKRTRAPGVGHAASRARASSSVRRSVSTTYSTRSPHPPPARRGPKRSVSHGPSCAKRARSSSSERRGNAIARSIPPSVLHRRRGRPRAAAGRARGHGEADGIARPERLDRRP